MFLIMGPISLKYMTVKRGKRKQSEQEAKVLTSTRTRKGGVTGMTKANKRVRKKKLRKPTIQCKQRAKTTS